MGPQYTLKAEHLFGILRRYPEDFVITELWHHLGNILLEQVWFSTGFHRRAMDMHARSNFLREHS
jgi:hypothetical protein